MSSTVSANLNKQILSTFTPAQFQAAVIPVTAWTRKIQEPMGVSLTGWEVNLLLEDNTNRDPNNGVIVELFENTDFPSEQAQITALLVNPPIWNSVFFLGYNSDTQYISTHRQYPNPFQLRYGISYALYMRALVAAVLTQPMSLSLTVFGFENVDTGAPQIQLR